MTPLLRTCLIPDGYTHDTGVAQHPIAENVKIYAYVIYVAIYGGLSGVWSESLH